MPTTEISHEEQAYDAVPYTSYPVVQSHPARIAALARIYGVDAVAPSQARILELGCAAAGNLLPVAARFPKATCLGIDISGVQIAQGHERIAAHKLTNITLVKRDITSFSVDDGIFDYIIAHGILSWVPPEVRAHIFRICRENLSPRGVAYMSYNALPGWHIKTVIRDAMRFDRSVTGEKAPLVAGAQEFLELMQPYAAASYGDMMAAEIRDARRHDPYFLTHDYLEASNTAFYFSEFLTQAKNNRLGYLTDADSAGTVSERFDEGTIEALRKRAGGNPLLFEQYLDFLSGRVFRMSLLVHEAQMPNARYSPVASAMDDLYFRCNRLTLKESSGETATLSSMFSAIEELRRQNVDEFAQFPVTMRALEYLLRTSDYMRPALSLRELAQAACQGEPSATEIDEVRTLLVEMFNQRMLHIYAEPMGHVSDESKPQAYLLTRMDAAAGHDHTSTPYHERLTVGPADRVLLPLLDGTHDRAALLAAVRAALDSGALSVPEECEQEAGDDPAKRSEFLLNWMLDRYYKVNVL